MYNNFMGDGNFYSRTEALIGADALCRLKKASVAVFGLGGVGGYVAEALVRAGVGRLTLIDGDVFRESNLNRQIFALKSTLGKNKAEAAKARLADINFEAEITALPFYFNKETAGAFDFRSFDYVIDAIDSVDDKVLLIKTAVGCGVPVISSMGAGGKLHTNFRVGDIFETKCCPLARVMRKRLKEEGIGRLKAVWSEEARPLSARGGGEKGKRTLPSISYVPGVCGLTIAGEVIRDFISPNF